MPKKVADIFSKSFNLIHKSDSDIYEFEGVATEEGTADKAGEVFAIGAFNDQIGKTVVVQVMHKGISTIIGSGVLSKNGSRVMIKGKLYKEVEAAKAIALAKSDGAQFNLSIGGKRLEWSWVTDDASGATYLKTEKASIREVSFTGEDQQAHPDAIVTKTDKGEDNMDKAMEELLKAILEGTKNTSVSIGDLAKNLESADLDEVKKSVGSVKEDLTKVNQLVADSEEKFAKVDELKEVKETLVKMDAIVNKLSGPARGVNNLEKTMDESVEAFNKYLKAGKLQYLKAGEELNEFSADYKKTISTDTASAGYLIPQILEREILKDLKENNSFFADAKMYTGKGKSIDIPVRDAWTNTVLNATEGSGVTNGDITWSLITLEAGILQSQIPITDEIRDDAAFDVAAEVMEAVSEDFNAKISEDIVNGVVAADQKFEGFTTNATLIANAIESVNAVGGGTLVLTYNDFVNLEIALKKHDRKNAKFYVSRDAYRAMKLMQDNEGRPLWLQGLTSSAPSTFMGYPVEEVFNMDDLSTAGNYPVLFANFGKMYGIFDRKGIMSEIDRQVANRIDLHVTNARMGGKTIRPWAGVMLEAKA